MPAVADIGSLITSDPNIRSGRPILAGTGVTVHRIAGWYKMGRTPEEIAENYPHISLGQVHAALAYYHSNQEQVERELAEDDRLHDELARRFPRLRPE
jgi:uncharacterized protein (DUF433 family)